MNVDFNLQAVKDNWDTFDAMELFGMYTYFITYSDNMFGLGEGVNRFFGYSDVEDRDIMNGNKRDKINVAKKVSQLKELCVIQDDIRHNSNFSDYNPNKYKLLYEKTGSWGYDKEQLRTLKKVILSLNGGDTVRTSKVENLCKVWIAVLVKLLMQETVTYDWLCERTGLSLGTITKNLNLLVNNQVLYKKLLFDRNLNKKTMLLSDEVI